jgi:hypothetical protein
MLGCGLNPGVNTRPRGLEQYYYTYASVEI